MSQFFNDLFAGIQGTPLESHASDSGSAWSISGGSAASNASLSGSGSVYASALTSPPDTNYQNAVTLPSAAFSVSATLESKTLINNTEAMLTLTDGTAIYRVGYYYSTSGGSGWYLQKQANPSASPININGPFATPAPSAGGSNNVVFGYDPQAKTFSLTVDGVNVFSNVQDSTYAPAHIGVTFYVNGGVSSPTTGFHWSALSASSADPKIYYISPNGSDSNSGTTSAAPWQTITKVNAATKNPGDQFLFQAGQSFTGTLTGSPVGSKASPIVFGTYGAGKATISCGNTNGAAFTNPSFVTLQNLVFLGVGVNPNGTMSDSSTNKKYAIDIGSSVSSGWLGGIRILNCQIIGCYGGILIHADAASTPVGFDGVEIGGTASDPMIAHDLLSFGAFIYGSSSASNSGSPYYLALVAGTHKNIHVHHARMGNVYGIPSATDSTFNFWGSGVVIANTTAAEVNDCEFYNCGQNNDDHRGGAVGCWAFESDRIAFRRCESHHNKTLWADGGGFDLDGGTSNSIIDGCYSHDNYGPAFQTGSFTGSSPVSGNTFRNNISENDSHGTPNPTGSGIQLFGTVSNILIEGNTFYNSSTTPTLYNNNATTTDLTVRNNLLISSGTQPFISLPNTATLLGNLYYSQSGSPHWTWGGVGYTSLSSLMGGTNNPETISGIAVGVSADPLLANPGFGGTIGTVGDMPAKLSAYDPATGSPAFNAGVGSSYGIAATMAALDFRGSQRWMNLYPTIGAIEGQPTSIANVNVVSVSSQATSATGPINCDSIQTNAATAAMRATNAANQTTQAQLKAAVDASTTAGVVSAIKNILTGITSLPKWLRALVRSDAPDATAISEINAGGGTYDPTTESAQATGSRVATAIPNAAAGTQDGLALVGNVTAAGGNVTVSGYSQGQSPAEQLSARTVTVAGVGTNIVGAIPLTAGVDYNSTNGNALAFNLSSYTGQSISGATATLTITNYGTTTEVKSKTGTVTLNGSNLNLSFNLAAADTTSFNTTLTTGSPTHSFAATVTFADGTIFEVRRGTMTFSPKL